jgi:5'-nucleotidase
MPVDFSDTLVIGITTTALFDLTDADNLFRDNFAKDREKAVKLYRQYMLEREEKLLDDGTGMALIKALLDINKYQTDTEKPPFIEVVVMSRNSPETGIRVFNTIRQNGLKITRHAFTGGESVVDYLEAFDVDLFLMISVRDV